MLKSTRNVMSFILACVAIVAVASPASAVVEAGVVGGGIHMQYGPQDAGGSYMGIASESYDFYVDTILMSPPTGWGDGFPTWSGAQRPPDGIGFGYVLLAFNPYTGEVWNDIPAQHQALNVGGGYYGHTPTVGLTGVDVGGSPVASQVVQPDLVRGYTEDTVYITGAFMPAPAGITWSAFGSFVQTSDDGGILATEGWPVYAGGPALMDPGQEVRTYAPYEAGRPDCFEDESDKALTFDQTKTWGYTGFWDENYGWYSGSNGGAADNIYGFEMDGIKGWMRLDFAAHRTGVRLTEYYFDDAVPGDFNGDRAVDAADIDVLCDNMGSLDPVYDLDDGSGDGLPDGDVDEDDMIYLIEHLVELQDGSGRVGTKRGDFNLDGFVNGTDLALMKVAFGQPGQDYADGNANCDLFVDGTDLAILKVNFGFIAPTGGSAGLATGGGVPEPASLALLAMGCMAVLRRNRN